MTPFITAYVFTPLAVSLLVLLMIPLPSFLARLATRFVDWLFGLRLPGTDFQLFNVATALSFLSMASCVVKLQGYNKDLEAVADNGASLKAQRWRTERNFWMNTFCFASYITLFQYHKLLRKLHIMEEERRRQ